MIVAKGLKKAFSVGDIEIRALDGVDVEVSKGDMTAIIGSSGSGKSTLMNVLGCLDVADSGSYFLAGDDVSGLSEDKLAEIRNRHIGFIFQTFNLLPRMSALENVELPLLYGGRSGTRDKAAEALREVGLGDRMHHEPNQLSGGQRQRVAVARALAGGPEILLADEPTGNLDKKTGMDILRLFQELNQKGRTLVIVTHDPFVADHCRNRICMSDGKVVDKN